MDKSGEDWNMIVDELGPQFEAESAARDATDAFVAEHYPILRERGLLDALVPAEFGGGGAAYADVAAVLRRLAYFDGPTALALSMHQHLVAAQVFNHKKGRPAPLLPKVASEKMVLVSTGARDWLESNGEARRVEGGFLVSARKAFASGSPVGGLAVTSVPYEDEAEGWQVLHFAVPLSAAGIRLDDDWQVHGMRATGSQTIVLHDVFVPETAVSLRRPRAGFAEVFNVVIVVALPLIAGVYLGVAERGVQVATDLASKRPHNSTVYAALGEAKRAVFAAAACHSRMLSLTENLEFAPSLERSNEILALKTELVNQARKAVELGMEAAGGAGFYRRSGLERLLRDVHAGHYHLLPARQQAEFTGRLALGLAPTA